MRTTFAVGRLSSGAAEIVLLEDAGRPSFPGPWTLRAVVRERTETPAKSASPGTASRDCLPSASVGHDGRGLGTGTVH